MPELRPDEMNLERRSLLSRLVRLVIPVLVAGVIWGVIWFTAHLVVPPPVGITKFPIPAASSLRGITAGPDGNLWFTEQGGNQIGRISPSGTITEFQVPTPRSGLGGITTGPDGNLWFTEGTARSSDKIGRISPNGTITEFPLPPIGGPEEITAGPDGNLWFTNITGNEVGRYTPGK